MKSSRPARVRPLDLARGSRLPQTQELLPRCRLRTLASARRCIYRLYPSRQWPFEILRQAQDQVTPGVNDSRITVRGAGKDATGPIKVRAASPRHQSCHTAQV
jgi:hypothetical protein